MLGMIRIQVERSVVESRMGILTVWQVFVHLVWGRCETSGRPQVFQSREEPRVCGCDYVTGRSGGFERHGQSRCGF